jgi:hypothetical protein
VNRAANDSNKEASFRSHSLRAGFNKWFTNKISAGMNVSGGFTNYANPDRFAAFADPALTGVKRENTSFSLAASLNYRLTDNFRFFMSYSRQSNNSNLPVFVFDQELFDERPETGGVRPLRDVDVIGVPLQNASLGDYEKDLITIGMSVNF